MKECESKNVDNLYNKLFPFLIGIIPFVFPTIVNDPSQTPLYLYLYIISFLLFLFNYNDLSRLRFGKLDLLYLLAFLVGLVSAFINKFDFEAVYELLRFVSVFLFIATFRFYFSLNTIHFDNIIKALSVVCVLYLLFGIWNIVENNILFFNNETSYLINSHLGHRNLFAILLAMFLPILFINFLSNHTSLKKTIMLFLIIVVIGFIFILMSRVGWIGCIIFIIVACYFLYNENSKRRIVYIVQFILIVGILLFFGFSNTSSRITQVQDRITSFLNYNTKVNDHTSTINERLILWKKSMQLIKSHFFIGVGPGQWKFQIPKYDLSGTRAEFGNIVFPQPHNDFIWYVSEMGIFGGGLVFLFFGSLFYISFTFLKNTEKSKERNIILFAIAGIFIFLTTSFFDFPKERPVHNFVLSFFISTLFFYSSSNEFNKKGANYVTRIILFLFLIGSLFFAIRMKGEMNLYKMLSVRSKQDYETELKYANLCHKFGLKYDLTTTPISFYEGEALVYQSKIKEAIDKFNKSIQENPYHLYSYSNLGSCFYVLGDKNKALAMWNQVLSISPNYSEARVNKAILYYQEHNLIKAEEVLRYKTMESQFEVYKAQIVTIFGEIVNDLSVKETNELLKQKMSQIAQDKNWIFRLFLSMNLKNHNQKNFKQLLYEDAIYDLEINEHKLDSKMANSLRDKI